MNLKVSEQSKEEKTPSLLPEAGNGGTESEPDQSVRKDEEEEKKKEEKKKEEQTDKSGAEKIKENGMGKI